MAQNEVKKLYRSRSDKILGGVCGGMAEYFEMDPSMMRLIWVFLALITGGTAVLAYLIAWVIVPQEPVGGKPRGASKQAGGKGKR